MRVNYARCIGISVALMLNTAHATTLTFGIVPQK